MKTIYQLTMKIKNSEEEIPLFFKSSKIAESFISGLEKITEPDSFTYVPQKQELITSINDIIKAFEDHLIKRKK